MPFDYDLDFSSIDFRAHPELYRVGKGEQGVLLVEPYKRELLPLWRFKTPEIARQSAQALCAMFEQYKAAGDFVGMDMARKYIQMGYTRARRYANHRSGRKYDAATGAELPRVLDPVKAEAAAVFHAALERVKNDAAYQSAKQRHIQQYGK